MNYQNRFVLFLDILGFKKIIEKTIEKEEDKPLEIDNLYAVLKMINGTAINKSNIESRKATQFSDSIVVSFHEDDSGEFLNLLDDISKLLFQLVFKGIICRGAIAYGKFIHDNNFLFGPALNEAYETESKAAMYPRIILDKSITKLLKEKKILKNKGNEFLDSRIEEYLQEDLDDKLFLDYFYNPVNLIGDNNLYLEYLETMRTHISNGSRSAKSPDIKVKYGWMKQKFNKTILSLSKTPKLKLAFNDTQKIRLNKIKSFD